MKYTDVEVETRKELHLVDNLQGNVLATVGKVPAFRCPMASLQYFEALVVFGPITFIVLLVSTQGRGVLRQQNVVAFDVQSNIMLTVVVFRLLNDSVVKQRTLTLR